MLLDRPDPSSKHIVEKSYFKRKKFINIFEAQIWLTPDMQTLNIRFSEKRGCVGGQGATVDESETERGGAGEQFWSDGEEGGGFVFPTKDHQETKRQGLVRYLVPTRVSVRSYWRCR